MIIEIIIIIINFNLLAKRQLQHFGTITIEPLIFVSVLYVVALVSQRQERLLKKYGVDPWRKGVLEQYLGIGEPLRV